MEPGDKIVGAHLKLVLNARKAAKARETRQLNEQKRAAAKVWEEYVMNVPLVKYDRTSPRTASRSGQDREG